MTVPVRLRSEREGGMNVNVWGRADIRAFIRSGAGIDVAKLTDLAVPIADGEAR